ncbi:hypothetical protein B0H14DRAFT_2591437 [Mycena olivaceomarginata]|nr:hypothetical protein B0H14DRAFT_2591437 [Mycena olivaceomarginata]
MTTARSENAFHAVSNISSPTEDDSFDELDFLHVTGRSRKTVLDEVYGTRWISAVHLLSLSSFAMWPPPLAGQIGIPQFGGENCSEILSRENNTRVDDSFLMVLATQGALRQSTRLAEKAKNLPKDNSPREPLKPKKVHKTVGKKPQEPLPTEPEKSPELGPEN